MRKCEPRSLSPFLDGELTEDAWQELDEHLHSCPACSTQLDELTAASQQVRAMGRAQIPKASLEAALDVIVGRTGLPAESVMHGSKEITWGHPDRVMGSTLEAAGPALEPAPPRASGWSTPQIIQEQWPADADSSDLAWMPGEAPIDPLPEMGAPPEPLTGTPPQGQPEDTPTWVEPERWQPTGPGENGAPASVSSLPSPETSPEPTPPVDPAATDPDAERAEQVAPTEAPEPESGAALETHPAPPPAQLVPSWMETPPASDAELESVGRAAVDDALGPPAEPDTDSTTDVEVAPMPHDIEPTPAAEAELRAPLVPGLLTPEATQRPEAERLMWITPRPPVTEPPAEVEAEPVTAIARLPEVDSEPEATPEAKPEPDDDGSHLRGYREALQWARAQPAGIRTGLLSSPEMRIRVGLAAAIVVILVSAGIVLSARSIHPSTTAVSQPRTSHATAPTPGSPPTPSVAPTTAASPASPVPGALAELVTAGSGGTGWTVTRIRLGSPSNGVTRVVLDLNGTGSTPTAQLGRGGDGSIYLRAPGMTIPPSVVSGLSLRGPLTAITEVDGSGTSLRFKTNGSPGFSIGYLSAPNRLVLDFK